MEMQVFVIAPSCLREMLKITWKMYVLDLLRMPMKLNWRNFLNVWFHLNSVIDAAHISSEISTCLKDLSAKTSVSLFLPTIVLQMINLMEMHLLLKSPWIIRFLIAARLQLILVKVIN